MDAALTYLGARMRTETEVKDKLASLGYTEEDVLPVLERLRELGLVNDGDFAGEFVRTRRASGNVSKAHIRYQLMKHKADPDAIDEALGAVTPEEESASCLELAAKLARQKSGLPVRERKQKVLAALCRRGFSTETALGACRKLDWGDDDDEPYSD